MSRVNPQGYVERMSRGSRGNCSSDSKGKFRNWWFVKWGTKSLETYIGKITFPKEYAGKRIRLKVEIVDDESVKAEW